MNAVRLQEHLSGQPDKIQMILESLDYTGIKYNATNDTIRFAREQGTNPSSCVINVKNLRFTCFSTNDKGDIFTLVMLRHSCGFPAALRYVAAKLGFGKDVLGSRIKLPFGGFYRGLKPADAEDALVQTYPEETLKPYAGYCNKMFLDDGISLQVQEEFGIGYDPMSRRITIPERTPEGELAGVMGRSIDADCPHEERWLPVVRCSRSQLLFGYSENYKDIIEADSVVLFESEKAVMQCRSFGIKNVLALCGCHISKTQARLIKALRVSQIIVAFDEGLEEKNIREECRVLCTQNKIYSAQVGYIYDHNNDIVPEYSKMNIADLGQEAYIEALERKVIWVNGST